VIDEADDETARVGDTHVLDALARADDGAVDVSSWSRRSLTSARPLLAANARREYRRRVALALVAALVRLDHRDLRPVLLVGSWG
jgi:hypothetical protein